MATKKTKKTYTKPLTHIPSKPVTNNVDSSMAKPRSLRLLFRYDFLSTREYPQRFGK